MTQQSSISLRTGAYRRFVIVFSLLVFLSATIVAVANTSWAHRIGSAVKDMGTSVSPTASSMLHYAKDVLDKAHFAELAKKAISVFDHEIVENRKHGRMRVAP